MATESNHDRVDLVKLLDPEHGQLTTYHAGRIAAEMGVKAADQVGYSASVVRLFHGCR